MSKGPSITSRLKPYVVTNCLDLLFLVLAQDTVMIGKAHTRRKDESSWLMGWNLVI